VLALNNHFVTS